MINDNLDNIFTKITTRVSKEDSPDMCKCSTCGCILFVPDCIMEYDHHDGWEMPAYMDISCPFCEDGGCIGDFWFSEENNNV